MKALWILFFVTVCSVNCKKTYVPYDKNANLDFINMEAGGMNRPAGPTKTAPAPVPAPAPAPTLVPASPTPSTPISSPNKPSAPVTQKPVIAPTPTTQKPGVQNSVTPSNRITIAPTPARPIAINPYPTTTVGTTPLPGSVKQLINYYDSQGKGSVIRPYSYSQAVKQG